MDQPPDDFEPPPEDLEMAVEEFLGRPMAGNPADRIAALEKRLTYLDGRIAIATRQADAEELKRLAAERAEAGRQLAEWRHQNDGRN